MENFNIVFKKVRDFSDDSYYYEWEGLKKYPYCFSSMDDSLKEEQFYLDQVKEVKQIILRDIRRIMDYHLSDLDNSDILMENLEVLLETYDNGIDGVDTTYFDRDITNFITLNDSYLSFNNIQNNVDDDDYFALYGDVTILESIVLMDRNFKNYHFIHMATDVATNKTKTTIESFQINGRKVISDKRPYRGRFLLSNYSETTPQKIIKRITNRQRKPSLEREIRR